MMRGAAERNAQAQMMQGPREEDQNLEQVF